MIHPTPPQAPVGSTRLEERLNAPERTAATTPADSHLAVVAAAVARGEGMPPDLAERLRGCPAGSVEELVLPERIDHGQLRQQHQLGRVLHSVLAQRGPGGGQRLGVMRELTDSYSHHRSIDRRYQTRT